MAMEATVKDELILALALLDQAAALIDKAGQTLILAHLSMSIELLQELVPPALRPGL